MNAHLSKSKVLSQAGNQMSKGVLEGQPREGNGHTPLLCDETTIEVSEAQKRLYFLTFYGCGHSWMTCTFGSSISDRQG